MKATKTTVHLNDLPLAPAAAATEMLNTLADTGTITYPVDLQKVAKALGVNVYRAGIADDNISGFAVQHDHNLPAGAIPGANGTIFVNIYHSLTRQTFTVAHELGHIALRHMRSGKGIKADTVYRAIGQPYDAVQENEANQFAASLLMPVDDFRRMFVQYNGDPDKIATYFGVSTKAAMYRAKDLNLLNQHPADLDLASW